METETGERHFEEVESEQVTVSNEKAQVFRIFKEPAKFQPVLKSQKLTKKNNTPSKKRKAEDEISSNLFGNRPGTPSGQMLTSSIADIKSMCESPVEHDNPAKKLVTLTPDPECRQSSVTAKTSDNHVSQHHAIDDWTCDTYAPSVNFQWSTNYNKIANIHGALSELQTKMSEGDKEDSICKELQKMNHEDEEYLNTSQQQSASSVAEANCEGAEMEITNNESTDFATNNTMDVRTVMQMMKTLEINLKEDFRKQVGQMLPTADKYLKREKENELRLAKLNAKVEVCEARERMMIGAMANMTQKIKELENKFDMQEINLSKRTVILAGFEADEKKLYARQQLNDFMCNQLGIDVVIEEFYYIGSAQPRNYFSVS